MKKSDYNVLQPYSNVFPYIILGSGSEQRTNVLQPRLVIWEQALIQWYSHAYNLCVHTH